MTKYKFKGYTITNCGYHQPDHCVWWEAVDENGEACFHGNTLREVEFMILNDEWEQKIRRKDEEIEKLKASTVGNSAALREALKDNTQLLAVVHSDEYTAEITEQIDKNTSVLAAPARNCDVGTADEQADRFKAFCYANRTPDNECSKGCQFNDTSAVCYCQARWAQMPYEED